MILTPCCRCQIRGYPTLKVIHQGEEVKAYRGEHHLLLSCVLHHEKELTATNEYWK